MSTFGIPPLLQLLGDEDRQFLANSAVRRSYRDGEIIHERGDIGSAMSIVIEGSVALYRVRIDGNIIYASTAVAGQNYGDYVSICGTARSHRAVAQGPTRIDHYSQSALDELLVYHPPIVQALYRVAAYRLTTAVEVLDDMRMLPTHVRLAKMVLRMLRASPVPGEVQCRQDELCQILGLSSVSIVHNLKLLAADGLVTTGYKNIKIPDADRLEQWIAEHDWE
jgi:CRP-like cAMP-binding protein